MAASRCTTLLASTYLPILLFLFSSQAVATQTTVLPKGSFHSQAHFDKYWDYDYPWGNTHNGAARMTSSHCSLASGHLVETAVYDPSQPDTSSETINYLSCTVYAKQTFTVTSGGGYDFSADFIAPTVQGTWPAFWLTAVQGWPPEIDIAEWKGDGEISFNTFNTSSDVMAVNVEYPDASEWHSVRAEIRDEQDGSGDLSIAFYLDGSLQSTQYASDYVGKAFYLIIDLQMEGSSGSPGPTSSKLTPVCNVTCMRGVLGFSLSRIVLGANCDLQTRHTRSAISRS